MKKIKGVFVVILGFAILQTLYILFSWGPYIMVPIFLLYGAIADIIYRYAKEINILDHSPLVIAILIPVVLYSWMFLHISSYL